MGRQTDGLTSKQTDNQTETDSETDTGTQYKLADIHVRKKFFMVIESKEGEGEKWFEMGTET